MVRSFCVEKEKILLLEYDPMHLSVELFSRRRWPTGSDQQSNFYGELCHELNLATINLPKSPKLLGIFVKVSKSLIFRVKSFLGNSYRHSAIFSGHTGFNINRAAFCLGRYSLHLLLLNISMTCLRKDQMKYFLIQCIGLKKKKIRHVLIQKYG